MFTNQQTEQIKRIFLEDFGVVITDLEAQKRAVFLIDNTKEPLDRIMIKMKIEELLFIEKNSTLAQEENIVNNLALYFVSLARSIDGLDG